MKPVGGPPNPRIERPQETDAAPRADEKAAARAAQRAALRVARAETSDKASSRRSVDVFTSKSAEASRARAPSFDTEKVARLRALADRGACVPSPERIALALSEKSAPENPPEGGSQ